VHVLTRGGWRLLLAGVVCLLALMLAGCATQTQALLQGAASGLPRRTELSSTPFHPQERYQCGPATLAMSLNAAGISIGPDALVAQVYVPEREGSLPPEMLAAARRNGALGMAIPPRLDALLAEIAAGNPVIVLQNLSLPLFPLWHYALAIGYDLDSADIILRSGTTERLVMPMSTFEHTWARSGYWAMVALSPDRLPVTASESQAVDALVAFEKSSSTDRSRKAYEHALGRWPRNPILQMGLGNTAYAAGDLGAAAAAFRRVTEEHPGNAAAFNNLATVLAEMGDLDGATEAAECAVAIGGPWRAAAQATLESVRAERQRRRR
jgi:tetratricopeptide (TPR) repeat protein